MASLEQFLQTAAGLDAKIEASKQQAAEYEALLSQLEGQDPCAEGFQQQFDQSNQKLAEFRAVLTDAQNLSSSINAEFQTLGFFDKRSSAAEGAMTTAANLFRGLKSTLSGYNLPARREKITAAIQACKQKEPEEKDKPAENEEAKNADANADPAKTGENEQSDDQTSGSGSNPTEPDSQGQKNSNPSVASADASAKSLVRPNPLAQFSSYTYRVTLYMCTPEAYNSYLNNFEFPKFGTYIIAQSGGINSNTEPRAITLSGELGPGKPGLDYFIDDLKIQSRYPGKNGHTSVVMSSLTFKIYEPVGFGFLPRLSRACSELIKQSELLKKSKTPPVAAQMLYIMAIRFYGYDKDGEIVKTTAPSGVYDKFGSYERFFPLVASRMTTKLDGRVTTYNWEARIINEQMAFSPLFGKLNSKAYIEASTVAEAIGSLKSNNRNSLLGSLNAEQQALVKTDRVNQAVEYDVEFEAGSAIPNAQLIDDDEYSKVQAAMSGATRVEEVTPKLSIKAQSIDTKKKKLEVPEGMSIVNVIDQLITKSSYVTRTLNVVNNQRIETKTKENPSPIELQWFVVHPKVTILGWDDGKKYYNIRVTFQIKTFSVPYIRTQYVDRKSRYYGPLKFYKYWFTGQNTEVLAYEQTFNTLYYIIQPYSTSKDDEAESSRLGNVPASPDSNPMGNDTTGKINGGSKINESVRDSVYNIADQARATIRILGDPDYLMETIGGSLELTRNPVAGASFDRFYARRGSINPYGGQVFAEIVFYTAEDYTQAGDGLLDVNRDLTFYGTPNTKKILGNQGVIYQVIECNSELRRGQFLQTLNMLIVPPETLIQKSVPVSGSSSDGAASGGAGGGRGSAAYETRRLDQSNQTAMVEIRTGVNLNSQGRTATGRTANNTTYDARQSPVQVEQAVNQEKGSPPGSTTGSGSSNSQKPLSASQGVTYTADGSPVSNDDASVNPGPVRVAEAGREGDTNPGPQPEPAG